MRPPALTLLLAASFAVSLPMLAGCSWPKFWSQPETELPEHGSVQFAFGVHGTSLEPTLRADSPEERRLLDAAEPALDAKDWPRAIQILSAEIANASDPRVSGAGYLYRGVARQRSGDQQGAIADWTKSIELRPDKADALLLRALANLERGESEAAVADLNAAIVLEPANPALYTLRATAFLKQKEAEPALADLDRAIALKPNDAETRATRGMVHFLMKQYDRAAEDASASLAADPNNARTYMMRAVANRKLGREVESKADFAKARELGFKG